MAIVGGVGLLKLFVEKIQSSKFSANRVCSISIEEF